MTILVTGKNGQLARAIADFARHENVDLQCVGRDELDLTDVVSIQQMVATIKPTVVVNAGAYTDVERAEDDYERAFAINVAGTALLSKICADHGIPIVQISSDYVFDGRKSTPYIETDQALPINRYGMSKLYGENETIAANPAHVILRTSWIFSSIGRNFVRTMLRLARSESEIPVVSDQFGCPTYAVDLAEAILDVCSHVSQIKSSSNFWGIYHIAGRGKTSWHGLAQEIFEQSRLLGGPVAKVRQVKSSEWPTKATRPVNSALDCTKIKNTLKISLPPWQSGVSRCVAQILRETN